MNGKAAGTYCLEPYGGIAISPTMSAAQQRAWYLEATGREELPEPLEHPEWTLTPKQWLTMMGLDKVKRAPVKRSTRRQAELSPLELVARAKRDRERANRAFSEAVKAAVVAGEAPGKVGAAAGVTRQRVYQLAK